MLSSWRSVFFPAQIPLKWVRRKELRQMGTHGTVRDDEVRKRVVGCGSNIFRLNKRWIEDVGLSLWSWLWYDGVVRRRVHNWSRCVRWFLTWEYWGIRRWISVLERAKCLCCCLSVGQSICWRYLVRHNSWRLEGLSGTRSERSVSRYHLGSIRKSEQTVSSGAYYLYSPCCFRLNT